MTRTVTLGSIWKSNQRFVTCFAGPSYLLRSSFSLFPCYAYLCTCNIIHTWKFVHCAFYAFL